MVVLALRWDPCLDLEWGSGAFGWKGSGIWRVGGGLFR